MALTACLSAVKPMSPIEVLPKERELPGGTGGHRTEKNNHRLYERIQNFKDTNRHFPKLQEDNSSCLRDVQEHTNIHLKEIAKVKQDPKS